MPATGLRGHKVAVLATDGVEQVELTEPIKALKDEGATVELVSLTKGEIQAFNHLDKAERFAVDRTVTDADPSSYDALVIPGGVANPDALRMDEGAVKFVEHFVNTDKPVASICHGPWLLVEADAVKGRTLAAWPSLRTDIENAGGTWEDREVVVDQRFVTSRKPDDLPAFTRKMVAIFADALTERDVDAGVEQTFPASDPLQVQSPSSVGHVRTKEESGESSAGR